MWDVELDQTVLFPTGGGQPSDYGSLQLNTEEASIDVRNVFRSSDGRVCHQIPFELEPGTAVTVSVDWARRYDHMQQHSAQHLISAVARDLFGATTLSWWLASDPEACNIELDAHLDADQVQQLSTAVNAHIRSTQPVNLHIFESVEEAREHPLFRDGKRPVPERMEGPLRVVEIPGVDFNKCCGTHLRNTGELQLVSLLKADKVKGNCRLHFLAGQRAVSNANAMVDISRQLTAVLCTNPGKFPDVVQKMQADLRLLSKSHQKGQQELAKLEAASLLAAFRDDVACQVLSLHKEGDAGIPYLTEVAEVLLADPAFVERQGLAFLTCAEFQAKKGAFMLVGPAVAVKANGPAVAKTLEGRGGGRPGRYQGKAERVDQRVTALADLTAALASSEN